MSLHTEFLIALESVRAVDGHVVGDELRGWAEQFLARRWISVDGYLTSILVPVLDSEEEVEVAIDEDNGTFAYGSPGRRGRTITRPLAEIALYTFNVDAWLDEITDAFAIEPSRRARKREIIDAHLWHAGDLRVGRTSQFAPLYVARRLEQCSTDWRNALVDPVRPSQGIVLTAIDVDLNLPNSHQARSLECILISDDCGITCDHDTMDRLLRGLAADTQNPDEWFDDRRGELKLSHMNAVKVFKGKQKAVIAAYWRARQQHSLKWEDVMASTNCGKDPGSVFGKDVWREWLENVGHGLYRIRTCRKQE